MAQQPIVECKGQFGAQKKVWPSTSAKEVPRCNNVLVPLDPGFQGRESGIVPVQRLFHYNIIHAQVTLHTSFIHIQMIHPSSSIPSSTHLIPPHLHPITLLIHLIFISPLTKLFQVLRRWGKAKQQAEVTTGSCSLDPTRRRPRTSVVHPYVWGSRGVRQHPWRQSSPI